jgi:hypothetical protein
VYAAWQAHVHARAQDKRHVCIQVRKQGVQETRRCCCGKAAGDANPLLTDTMQQTPPITKQISSMYISCSVDCPNPL